MTTITTNRFGKLSGEPDAQLFTISNKRGMRVQISDYGATITSIIVPDRDGKLANVVLGFDTLDQYRKRRTFFGATIGRYANRIGNARCVLDGRTIDLTPNELRGNLANHLHGGEMGFDTQHWSSVVRHEHAQTSLDLNYLSVDGEEGYPGNLQVRVSFHLTEKNELNIEYFAHTDATTFINFTNHSFFNLSGNPSSDVLGNTLRLFASRYTPLDNMQIPTGVFAQVKDTPLDFTANCAIGERIDDEMLKRSGGYDHNFVLDKKQGDFGLAAMLIDPTSGRRMVVSTTEPGVQLYTANHLEGEAANTGKLYAKYPAVCLETQHYPDSPNQSTFPSTRLDPDQSYYSRTQYRFDTIAKANDK